MAVDLTKIAKCDCTNDFQDNKYGKKMRVHNPAFSKGGQPRRYRCTVCRKEKNL